MTTLQKSPEQNIGDRLLLNKYNGNDKKHRQETGDYRDSAMLTNGLSMADSQYGDKFRLLIHQPAPTTFKALESVGEKIASQDVHVQSRDHHHDGQFFNAKAGGLSGCSGLNPN